MAACTYPHHGIANAFTAEARACEQAVDDECSCSYSCGRRVPIFRTIVLGRGSNISDGTEDGYGLTKMVVLELSWVAKKLWALE
ncbi:hypothetical protein Gotri_012651, partial [Gossypium trilobum]|nr:hypothetical protein [Gossypium trilobum]